MKFCQEICIPCYDTDAKGLLKPAAFMDLAQEVAYWAASDLGFGYDSLHIHHTAWVLTRMHIHFEQPLRWRENVSLYTWHKGANGLFYLRDFDVKDKDGISRITATSSWVVIDERTRRIARPEDIANLPVEPQCTEDAIAVPAPKIQVPGMTEKVPGMTHRVAYSDLDINGHTNNARYVVWAMDCLPQEVTAGGPVKDLYINFIKETVPGDNVQLYSTQEGNAWYVEGRVGDKTCFLVKMEF